MELREKSPAEGGIGTLNERSLHAFLKERCGPASAPREVRVGRYIADIADGDRIIEIQTRGFSHLRRKLEYFLEGHDVTVVYPVAQKKRLIWVDPGTGEALPARLSPKKGLACEIFYELIHIKSLLLEPRLSFKIVLLELDEYRLLDGWGGGGKRGSTRADRVPLSVFGEIDLKCPGDYKKLLPHDLGTEFTVAEFMRCARASRTLAQRAVNVLCAVGALKRAGKSGRAFLYSAAP